MYIEELSEGGCENGEQQANNGVAEGAIVVWDAKRALVGAGARALFYPTLLYNVVRNKLQSEFRWWDRVDEFILLGAVPFPTDVPRLKALGVGGVVTLNEPYETLVPTSLYHDYNIEHLVIPTRDYLFAPVYGDVCQAVEFIHSNTLCGKTTYVHCKAGRGRSTTIVLCYLVKHKKMTPDAAFQYVRSIRPRVLLASSQWQAVQDYYIRLKEPEVKTCTDNPQSLQAVQDYYIRLKEPEVKTCTDNPQSRSLSFPINVDLEDLDYGSIVVVDESDLDGYEENFDSNIGKRNMMTEVNLACRVQFASQAAIARLSCLWLRTHSEQKATRKKMGSSVGSSQIGSLGVDVHVH